MTEFTTIGHGPMSPHQIVRAWVMRFNAADADAIAELYHENAMATSAAGGPTTGSRRIRRMFEKRFRHGTSPRFAETIYGLERTVNLDWRDLDGKCGTEFFTVDGNKITTSGARPHVSQPPS